MAQGMHTVVVTGFGPFHTNKVNVSWEVAKELTKMGLDSQGINLVVREIPVSYQTVCNEIPKIWEEHSPELVIHMGLSNLVKVVCLESVAYRCGYTKPDIHGIVPPGGAYPGTQAAICSQFDLVKIIHKLRKLPDMNVLTALSSDAGRYVCEFIYYSSLNINNHRTIFIHLPNINLPYTVKELASCVKYIILFLMEEIEGSGQQSMDM